MRPCGSDNPLHRSTNTSVTLSKPMRSMNVRNILEEQGAFKTADLANHGKLNMKVVTSGPLRTMQDRK